MQVRGVVGAIGRYLPVMDMAGVLAQSDVVAQSGVVDEIESLVNSTHVTGWEVVAAIAVLIIAFPVGHLAARLVRMALKRLPNSANIPPIVFDDVARLARWLVWLVAIGISLSILGASTGWLTIVAVFLIGIAALALRPMLENTAAGLVLTLRPAFTIGDQIEVEGNRGTVLEIGGHSTVVQTVDGTKIYTPNSKMLQETVTVLTASDTRRTEFSLNVDGSTDVTKAVSIFTSALRAADVIVDDPAPHVVASGFDGDGILLTARVWYPSTITSDSPAIDAAVQAVTSSLQKAGIKLNKNDVTLEQVSPTFDVTVHGDRLDTADDVTATPTPSVEATEGDTAAAP
jgi:small-conductance mechanosensitive channel